MAENTMERKIILEQMRQMRPQIMADFKKQVEQEGRPLYGEAMELSLDSGVRSLRHYVSAKENPPVFFDIHGGGYTWGTIEDGTLFDRELCDTLGWEVYALDYPLVPDAEYPAQLEWVYETISYLRAHAAEYHFDPERMVVGGRSAGANMSAVLCLYAKEKGEFQFGLQVLDHPWLDMCSIIPWDAEHRYAGPEALSAEVMAGLALGYTVPENLSNKLCSPLAASKEELTGLPPAVIQTCEKDSLRPEGDRYAELLAAAGVSVEHHCFAGAWHGFTEALGDISEQGRQWLIEAIRRTLG